MDELALASGIPERRIVLDRIEADRDHEIGLVEQAVGWLVMEQPDPAAETVQPVAWHHAGRLVGAGDGQPCAGEQQAYGLGHGPLAGEHAQQDDRPFRRIDQAGGFGDRFGVRGAQSRDGRRRQHRAGRGSLHHVLGQAEKGGARPAGLGGAERRGRGFGDRRRRIDFGGILGDRPQQGDRVHALMRLLQTVRDRHGPAQRDHGVALGVCGGETRGEIGDAGTGGDEHHARLARQAAQPACDEGRVLLMPADDELDLGIDQCIKDGIDLGAGNTEYVLDALGFEVAHQKVRAVFRIAAHRLAPLSIPDRVRAIMPVRATLVARDGRKAQCPG